MCSDRRNIWLLRNKLAAPRQVFTAVAAPLLLLLGAPSALAHKVKLFASAEGKAISGYAYYAGGSRPRELIIAVEGPGDQKLSEIKTNDRGEFVYEAAVRCDHTFVLDLEDGHSARFTVKADELPANLPAAGPAGTAPAAEPRIPAAASGEPQSAEPAVHPGELPASTLSGIEAAVSRAVSQQLRPLREQLDEFQEQAKLHDVLGGIGYIFGLAGAAFYFLGARRLPAPEKPKNH